MPEVERERPHKELQLLRKHQESNTMLAIIMAGITALFIVGIVVAYNYASSTSTIETAGPPPANPATRTAPETTGAGDSERPRPVVPDGSQKQR